MLMAKKQFADSYNSTSIIPIWQSWYKINMSEYIIPQNGFQSFNDFFTRQLKPGMRPISSPNNDSIIVSPCDGEIDGIEYDLQIDTELTVKNEKYNLTEMLNNNDYFVNKFIGGTAIEILLHQYNYHRYHASMSGYINSLDMINGYILVSPQWVNASIPYFGPNHNVRGVIYIETEFGYIAQVFVGAEEYNSVNFDVSPGIYLNKGDEIGCFKYGGSTVVILFEKDIIDNFDVVFGQYVQMGQHIGIANSKQFDKIEL